MLQPYALRWGQQPEFPGIPELGPSRFGSLGRAERHRVAVTVPMSGSAGIWGPSCIACAELAVAEINRNNGIGGREVEAVIIDADDSAVDGMEERLRALIDGDQVSAVVGMHVSSVRQRLNSIIRSRIPYVYTPLYEGNEFSPHVFTIGETASEQLGPALRRMADLFKVRRWALVGNDYVWPRVSNGHAKQFIKQIGGEVVFERYVPFGFPDPSTLVEDLATAQPDIVMLCLIGQEAVEFNRVFGAMGLDRRMVRFSTAIEENILLGAGAENTKRLYGVSSYFSSLKTDCNLAFKERYRSLHRERAPVLNALGQSLYEGMHFYAAYAGKERQPGEPVIYPSARGGRFYSNARKDNPLYLARADGYHFSVIERLA